MEDLPRQGTGAAPEAVPPAEDPVVPASSSGRPAVLWTGLVLLGLVLGTQGAGVLLRDRVEGRVAVGTAPAPGDEGAPPGAREGAAAIPAVVRFPPPVREVVVASGPPAEPVSVPPSQAPALLALASGEPRSAAPPAPPPAPEAAPASEARAPAPPQAVRPTPELAPAPEAASAPAPAPTAPPLSPPASSAPLAGASTAPSRPGTHVLQMGVFRSQKYRRETERRLEELGVPHYRVESTTTKGDSFRLAVPIGDDTSRSRGRAALERAGYLYRESPEGFEVRFFLEEEARQALEAVTRVGLPGAGYLRVQGEVTLWTVLAGPYSEQEARAERERLVGEGLESYLRRRP